MTGLVVGITFGLGVLLVFDAFTSPRPVEGSRWSRRLTIPARKAGLALASGAACLAFTGWPVAALAGCAIGWTLPGWLTARREGRERAARREAIAEAAARIRDAVRAGAGIPEAFGSLASHGPARLRPEFRQAALDLQLAGLPAGLEALRERLDDPLGDLLVRALLVADRTGGRNLSQVLDDLAESARRNAATLREVRAHQARNRSTATIVSAAPVVLLVAIRQVNPAYLAPYATAAGQLVLIVVFGLIALGYLAMTRVARLPTEPTARRRP